MKNIHVDMRWLREHPAALEQEAQLPRCTTLRADILVDDHGVEQSSSANSLDEGRIDRADR